MLYSLARSVRARIRVGPANNQDGDGYCEWQSRQDCLSESVYPQAWSARRQTSQSLAQVDKVALFPLTRRVYKASSANRSLVLYGPMHPLPYEFSLTHPDIY